MVRVRPSHNLEQFFTLPIVHRHRGHDDLGENIERVLHDMGWLYITHPHSRDYRRDLYRIVPKGWNQYSTAGDPEGVTSAPNALQCGGHALGRFKLNDQIDRSDVDPQLQ